MRISARSLIGSVKVTHTGNTWCSSGEVNVQFLTEETLPLLALK